MNWSIFRHSEKSCGTSFKDGFKLSQNYRSELKGSSDKDLDSTRQSSICETKCTVYQISPIKQNVISGRQPSDMVRTMTASSQQSHVDVFVNSAHRQNRLVQFCSIDSSASEWRRCTLSEGISKRIECKILYDMTWCSGRGRCWWRGQGRVSFLFVLTLFLWDLTQPGFHVAMDCLSRHVDSQIETEILRLGKQHISALRFYMLHLYCCIIYSCCITCYFGACASGSLLM